MTQAERLIRNVCEARRQQVLDEQRQAIKGVPEYLPLRMAPVAVRRAVRAYHAAEQRKREAEKVVAAAGFESGYYLGHSRRGRDLKLSNVDTRKREINAAQAKRLERIQQLKTNATIASLGKTAIEARAVLQALQADLGKV